MRIKETHISNRVLSALLAFVIIFSMIPISTVFAAGNSSEYGSVKAETGAPAIIGNETENTKVDFSDGVTLQFSEKNPAAGRGTDGWWAGIRVTAPSGVDVTAAKYQTYNGSTGWSEDKSFWNNKDSADNAAEHFIGLWGLVNQTFINEAKAKGTNTLEYKWQFNWDADDTFEQTVSMVIDINTVELMNNGTLVYPTTLADKGDVTAITPADLIVENNKSALVSVTLTDPCVLAWHKADPSVGRMSDGWWVGIKMTSPTYAGTTADELGGVTYQTAIADGWSANKSFWDNQDSSKNDGGEHYITLWGCVNEEILNTAKSNSKNAVYRWRFDWDKDGDFEQQVILNISPDNITLMKDNTQVYPGLGTVSAFTGAADVNGDATGNVVVSYKSPFELNFSKANPSIGRVSDGWWAGIKMTAPSGFNLSKAKYQTFNGNTNDWSAEKSFWSNKDSADSDTSHYIGLWGLLNESVLDNATKNGKSVEYKWQFDWNGDGIYEQSVNYVIDPAMVTLNKENQAPLAFEKGVNPDAVFFGDDFANKASGGTVSGTIKYTSSDETTATVDAEGNLDIKKSGEVTITATLAGNEFYHDVSASYNLTIYKADQKAEFLFSRGDNDKVITYGEEFDNPAFGGENEPISYQSSDETVAKVDENGRITALKAGTVTITAINPTDDRYNQKEISYKLTVKLADPTPKFENGTMDIPAITYGDSYKNAASAMTPITYSSSDKSIAEVADDGTLIIHKAGTITITATAKETEQYFSKSVSYEITINKASQNPTFEKGTAPTVIFNDNENRFVNTATTNAIANGEQDIEITYSLVAGQSLVRDFDEKTGAFTILGAGTISVSVAFGNNARYKQAIASYTLTVEKDDQTVAFPEESYNVVTGKDFNAPVAAEIGDNFGTGVITYAVKGEDESGIIKSLDKDTGAVTLTYKAGSVTIIATKAADANYNEATAEYTLTVNEWEPEEKYYTLTGNTKNDSGWFTGNVSVEAKDGYALSYIKENGEADWKQTLADAVVSDGDKNSIGFYVKDIATGYISKQQTEIIKKDIVLPQVEVKFAELTSWEKFLTIITLGIWEKDSAEFTVECSDEISGVQKVEYYIADGSTDLMSEDELSEITDWSAYSEKVSVDKDKIFVLYAKVTDNAGNVNYAATNGIVFDRTAPVINTTILSEDTDDFYKGDVEVNVNVTDAAPASGIQSVEYWVVTDGEETQRETIYQFNADNPKYPNLVSEWNTDMENKNIVVDSIKNNSDNVILYIKAVDNAGNESFVKEISLKISANDPTIDVDWVNDPKPVDTLNDVAYYDKNRTAKITITGRTSVFDESLVNIAVNAVNAKGTKLEGTYSISDWNTVESDVKDNATHTAYITFTGNANYTFTVDYTDKAQHTAKQYVSSAFTIDHDDPTATITVAETTWSKLITALTFGRFYNTATNVSAESDDETSPIKSVEYYETSLTRALTKTELENSKVENTDIRWQDFSEFPNPIASDERFTVYLRVTDYAGHAIYLSSNGAIVDMTESNIDIRPADANANGYYNADVPVEITVEDTEPYSGIDTVEYWIMCNGIETKREKLYDFDFSDPKSEPKHDQLKSVFNKTITVDAEANNSDDVVVWVKSVDNAGNVSTNNVELKIDATRPKIEITYKTDAGNVVDGRGYFKTDRVAVIKYTERTSTFNRDKATAGIVFSGVDVNGEPITLDRSAMIKWSETVEGAAPDMAVHTAEVYFTTDANYTLSVSYTDEADNANEPVDTKTSVTPYQFTVDKNDPTAAITATEKTWDKLLEVLTFGIWKNEDVTISAAAEDKTSPVTVEYYKTSDPVQKTKAELDAVSKTEWKEFKGLTITEDEQLVVYLKVTDYAGNYIYINADGIIVDKTVSELMLDVLTKASGVHYVAGGEDIKVYNTDVEVQIKVNEPTPYSGINKVEYWITCDGEETKREVLYAFDNTAPTQAELLQSLEKIITVSSKENNSCDVKVNVQVTDNAGNVRTEILPLDIDITPPTIEISYDNNVPYKTVGTHGYFPADRKATVVITERTAHFNANAATNYITIAAENALGKSVIEDTKTIIGQWISAEGQTKDSATHTAVIDFSADANYKFGITYTDTAGNMVSSTQTGSSVTPYEFTVDKTRPTGTVTVGELGTWDKLIETLTFGLWSRNTVSVSGTTNDVTSPIESVSFFKTNETTAKTEEDLKKITSWTEFKGFEVAPDEQFAVYLKIVDYAGNTQYISTNGIIVDKVAPVFEADAPEVHFTMPETVNGFYTGDVSVGIKVVDPKKAGTEDAYSGLKEVRYEILNLGEITETGTLLSFNNQNPIHAELIQNIERTVVIKSAENNSNDVEIRVYAVDNAGNEYVDGNKRYASEKMKIDITDPTITVTYDNNNGDTTFTDGTYFKANRTATIVVTERNFDPEKVVISLANTHGVVPKLSGWTTTAGTANGDNTTHTATLVYDADGDYTFDISCKEMSERSCESGEVDYGTSLAPKSFTIDKTVPTFTVQYDNNDSLNGNYYKAQRVATITVTEHNFETSRVKIQLTATDDGKQAQLPIVSGWSSNGDVHTATITYAADSLYTFDFDYTDKAGNQTADIQEQTFYVDKTAPTLTITGVSNLSANNGDVIPVVSYSDTNYDASQVKITLSGANRKAVELDGAYADQHNGRIFTFKNFAKEKSIDDIYTLTAELTDKAGNKSTQTILFSVNRFGSTYSLSEATEKLNGSYVKAPQDVVITEVNANELKNIKITLFKNNETIILKEGDDYKLDVTGSNEQWYQYTYTVLAKNFADDGVYRITLHSEDKAGNIAENTLDTKNLEIGFGVDATAPVINIKNLDSRTTYAVDNLTVEMTVKDNLKLAKVIVMLDGKEYKVWTGEELEKIINDGGNFTFDISGDSTSAHNLIVYAVDTAGNGVYSDGSENIEVISESDIPLAAASVKDFFVTTNLWVRYYTNKPLFFGSIGGVILLGGLIVFLVVFKKRKKEEK